MKKILLIPLMFFLVSCFNHTNYDYVWYRNKNEKFILNWKFEANKLITLNTYVDTRPLTDSQKVLTQDEQRNIKERQYINDYWDNCKYFDDENWSCSTAQLNDTVEMLNGELTWYYYDEVRKYKKIENILKNLLP